MRCIALLLLGLISAPYALPVTGPPPEALFEARFNVHHVEELTYDYLGPEQSKWWFDDMQSEVRRWATNFIEQRLFKEVLGVTATIHPPDGENIFPYFWHHPGQKWYFAIRSSTIVVLESDKKGFVTDSVSVITFMRYELNRMAATPSIVEVAFNDRLQYALISFKNNFRHSEGREDHGLVIELNNDDRDLFRRCDAYKPMPSMRETESSRPANGPSTPSSPPSATDNRSFSNHPSRHNSNHPASPYSAHSSSQPNEPPHSSPPRGPPPPYSE
ncbi:hypothetical protein EV360DRAFT_71353 [Lentinula raphanica]|nr:hypothetical protein EV360DRAFT_71353 [Lentinula raphanica]